MIDLFIIYLIITCIALPVILLNEDIEDSDGKDIFIVSLEYVSNITIYIILWPILIGTVLIWIICMASMEAIDKCKKQIKSKKQFDSIKRK